jgi:hypothetical protein
MTTRTPLWYRGEASPDFMDSGRQACMIEGGRINNLFFGEDIEALAGSQAICVRCPVFRECTRWTMYLSRLGLLEFGIFAGLTPEVRERLNAGVDRYYDWRPAWNRRYSLRHLAEHKTKQLRKQGRGKRLQSKDNMPPCPYCHQTGTISLNGRSTSRSQPDRQRYRCTDCHRNFLGEEVL